METRILLEDYLKDDNVIEFAIEYSLSTNYGFDFYDLLKHLPKAVENEEELLGYIKEFVLKSEFIKEIDEFNTLEEISNVEFQ